MLVRKCVCGSTKFEPIDCINNIQLSRCADCLIKVQDIPLDSDAYIDMYKTTYHDDFQSGIGRDTYSERYAHDLSVAHKRIAAYKPQVGKIGSSLDIGSANGAFVDAMLEIGSDAYGVECNPNLGAPDRTYHGALNEVTLPSRAYDLVTMHDVLEHIEDPVTDLKTVRRILKDTGTFVVDFPNYYVEEGKHHWRETQHVWYFTQKELMKVLANAGFRVSKITAPIPSKLVFFCKKSKLDDPPKKILVLPGIGDIYWIMIKLEDFILKNNLGVPEVSIWDIDDRPRSEEYIARFPFVTSGGYYKQGIDALFHSLYITGEKDVAENTYGFDYIISANGGLRVGKSMDEIMPEYDTNWYPEMHIPREEEMFGRQMLKEHGPYIVAGFSDFGMFQHWAKYLSAEALTELFKELIAKTGCKIILTGSSWDAKFNQEIKEIDGIVNMVGQTTLDQFFGLVRYARAYVGHCGGNSIISVAMKKPTLMFWHKYFKEEKFFTNCCDPESVDKWYKPMLAERYTLQAAVDKLESAIKFIDDLEKEND